MTMAWPSTGTSTASTSYSTIYLHSPTSSTTSTVWSDTGTNAVLAVNRPPMQTHLVRGQKVTLPDGSKLEIDYQGNFKILDDDAKITYLGNRIREFNKFINASDLLEQFIKDLGSAGIRQGEVLAVPIEAFINWIVHMAAEQDGDPVPDEVPKFPLEDWGKRHPRCKGCGRFIPANKVSLGVNFCSGLHMDRYLEKQRGERMRGLHPMLPSPGGEGNPEAKGQLVLPLFPS